MPRLCLILDQLENHHNIITTIIVIFIYNFHSSLSSSKREKKRERGNAIYLLSFLCRPRSAFFFRRDLMSCLTGPPSPPLTTSDSSGNTKRTTDAQKNDKENKSLTLLNSTSLFQLANPPSAGPLFQPHRPDCNLKLVHRQLLLSALDSRCCVSSD